MKYTSIDLTNSLSSSDDSTKAFVLEYNIIIALIIFVGILNSFRISDLLILSMESKAFKDANNTMHASRLFYFTPSVVNPFDLKQFWFARNSLWISGYIRFRNIVLYTRGMYHFLHSSIVLWLYTSLHNSSIYELDNPFSGI